MFLSTLNLYYFDSNPASPKKTRTNEKKRLNENRLFTNWITEKKRGGIWKCIGKSGLASRLIVSGCVVSQSLILSD